MDRDCHFELAFRMLSDSTVRCAPASTPLAFGGRWTERWLRRQLQSHPVQWSQTFLWGLLFLFATNSNLLLWSYSNETITFNNTKLENGNSRLKWVYQYEIFRADINYLQYRTMTNILSCHVNFHFNINMGENLKNLKCSMNVSAAD